MKSSVPYMLRALNEWIIDSDCTPHLVVDATADGVIVPREHVQDGRIVLNISMSAVRNLLMSDETVTFGCRFGGMPFDVEVPLAAVLGIVARENGEGMMFPRTPASEEPSDAPADSTPHGTHSGVKPSLIPTDSSLTVFSPADSSPTKPSPGRGHLKVVD